MSLTKHLSTDNSPVAQYFKTYFNFKPFLEEENSGLVGAYTIRPKSFDNYPWADMGHIVEYLLVLHLGISIEQLLPMRFAKDNYSSIFSEMKNKYGNFNTKSIHFKQLTDDLYKLSKVEAVYRNGVYTSLSSIQNLTSTYFMQEDLKTIYELSLSQIELFNNKNVKLKYNPTFDLSSSVGGADADLYIIRPGGNYLLDLKTTVKPVVKEDMMCQLLGYVFLDKTNQHKFKDVGLYLPRQNLISEWNIEDLIKNYSTFKSMEEAKVNFIHTVQKLNNSPKRFL